jgi:hypothetical protein
MAPNASITQRRCRPPKPAVVELSPRVYSLLSGILGVAIFIAVFAAVPSVKRD